VQPQADRTSSAAAHRTRLRASLEACSVEVQPHRAHPRQAACLEAVTRASPLEMPRSLFLAVVLEPLQAVPHRRRPHLVLETQLVCLAHEHSSRMLANKERQRPLPQPHPHLLRPHHSSLQQHQPVLLLVQVYSVPRTRKLAQTCRQDHRYLADRSHRQAQARQVVHHCLADSRLAAQVNPAHLSSAQSQPRHLPRLHPDSLVVRPQASLWVARPLHRDFLEETKTLRRAQTKPRRLRLQHLQASLGAVLQLAPKDKQLQSRRCSHLKRHHQHQAASHHLSVWEQHLLLQHLRNLRASEALVWVETQTQRSPLLQRPAYSQTWASPPLPRLAAHQRQAGLPPQPPQRAQPQQPPQAHRCSAGSELEAQPQQRLVLLRPPAVLQVDWASEPQSLLQLLHNLPQRLLLANPRPPLEEPLTTHRRLVDSQVRPLAHHHPRSLV
jgi:hypothetical protein